MEPLHYSTTARLPEGRRWASLSLIALCVPLVLGCGGDDEGRGVVVVYSSVDQHHSEPVLEAFEARTGIEVRAVYDVEAAKTTGLVNRLIAEREYPQADVFWNGEFAQTILLKELGVLVPYESPSAVGIPDQLKDPEHYWTGTSGRARVFIVNTDLVEPRDYPGTLDDLLAPEYPEDRIAIALPVFGTTATHAAALYAALGPTEARSFFGRVRDRGVRIEAGNSTVRDLVASGDLLWGVSDTDDAAGALERGAPVTVLFPEQGDADLGTLLVPTTVALIAGAPHREEARRLVDFLLSPEVEGMLVESGWCHVPLRPVDVRPLFIDATDVKLMDVALTEVYQYIQQAKDELQGLFVR